MGETQQNSMKEEKKLLLELAVRLLIFFSPPPFLQNIFLYKESESICILYSNHKSLQMTDILELKVSDPLIENSIDFPKVLQNSASPSDPGSTRCVLSACHMLQVPSVHLFTRMRSVTDQGVLRIVQSPIIMCGMPNF